MADARPPITCHVLDTTTGRPASNITVTLHCITSTTILFSGTTNGDGRITSWLNSKGPDGVGAFVEQHGGANETIKYMIKNYALVEEEGAVPAGSSLWKLEFDTGTYYGVANTFFPKVQLSFLVKEGEHVHVPLLLGPYSYTTYRGS